MCCPKKKLQKWPENGTKWPKMIGTSGTNPLGGLILPIYTLTKQKKTKKKFLQFCTTSYNTVECTTFFPNFGDTLGPGKGNQY